MDDQTTNYDDVTQYRLDPEREQELVNTAGVSVMPQYSSPNKSMELSSWPASPSTSG